MKLILTLEEEFNITFSDDQIIDMITVELILTTLKEQGVE
jgi:acyl carrier protein